MKDETARKFINKIKNNKFYDVKRDVESQNAKRHTFYRYNALAYACKYNNYNIAKLLIEHGSSASESCTFGRLGALYWATAKGNLSLVKLLIRNGAIIDDEDECSDESFLEVAVSDNNLEIARYLLKHGANPLGFCGVGYIPLYKACSEGNIEMVSLLLKYGADPNLTRYGSDKNETMDTGSDDEDNLSIIELATKDKFTKEINDLILNRNNNEKLFLENQLRKQNIETINTLKNKLVNAFENKFDLKIKAERARLEKEYEKKLNDERDWLKKPPEKELEKKLNDERARLEKEYEKKLNDERSRFKDDMRMKYHVKYSVKYEYEKK